MPALATKHRYQTALHWARTGPLVNGEPVRLAPPEEIKVRWNQTRREVRSPENNTIALDAQVVTGEQLAEGSLVWLGSEDDWQGAGITAGFDVHQVETTKRVPSLKNRFISYEHGLKRFRDYLPDGSHLLRITDLELWLHGDRGLLTTSVGTNLADAQGDAVGRWESLDEHDHKLVQASTSLRASLDLNVLNSKQAVRFDSTNEALEATSEVPLTGDFTAFYAVKMNAADLTVGLYGDSGAHLQAIFTTDFDIKNNAGSSLSAGVLGATTQALVVISRSGGTISVGASGLAYAAIGSLSGTITVGNLGYPGDVAWYRHVMLFSKALSYAERNLVLTYLKADTGLELP